MKVLFISSVNNKEDICPIVRWQGESLIKEGVDLQYFTIKGKGIRGYLSNHSDLKQVISQMHPEIVHAHYSNCAYLAFLANGKKNLITSFMGDDLLGSRKKNGVISLSSKIIAQFNNFFAFLFIDFSIVKSKQMSLKLWTHNKEIISNGVNFEKFYCINKQIAQDKLGFDKSNKHIVFVSNPLRAEKNYNLAKSAIEYLNSTNIILHTVFDVKTEELVYYYNAADALILTSFHEGSPNVIKEAMACNIPIVSTDVGDVKEVIGKTEGCYITSFNPEDVADKIKLALSFGKRTTGREDIQHLEASLIAKKIINVYTKVLQK